MSGSRLSSRRQPRPISVLLPSRLGFRSNPNAQSHARNGTNVRFAARAATAESALCVFLFADLRAQVPWDSVLDECKHFCCKEGIAAESIAGAVRLAARRGGVLVAGGTLSLHNAVMHCMPRALLTNAYPMKTQRTLPAACYTCEKRCRLRALDGLVVAVLLVGGLKHFRFARSLLQVLTRDYLWSRQSVEANVSPLLASMA